MHHASNDLERVRPSLSGNLGADNGKFRFGRRVDLPAQPLDPTGKSARFMRAVTKQHMFDEVSDPAQFERLTT